MCDGAELKAKNELGSQAARCQRRLKSSSGLARLEREREPTGTQLRLQTSPMPLEIQLLLSHQAELPSTNLLLNKM